MQTYPDIARALEDVAKKFRARRGSMLGEDDVGTVFDIHGNAVGVWRIRNTIRVPPMPMSEWNQED